MTLEVQLSLCSTVRKLNAFSHNPLLPLQVPFLVESPFTKNHKNHSTNVSAVSGITRSFAPSNASAVDESVSYLAFPARLLDAYACTAYPLFLRPGNHELDRLKQLGG